MAILRKAQIRKMALKERNEKVVELKKARTGSVESSGRVRELRRTIARILTINNEEITES
jgi:large subunit ribosomal protein L29